MNTLEYIISHVCRYICRIYFQKVNRIKVDAFLILIDATNLPSIRVIQIYSPFSNV